MKKLYFWELSKWSWGLSREEFNLWDGYTNGAVINESSSFIKAGLWPKLRNVYFWKLVFKFLYWKFFDFFIIILEIIFSESFWWCSFDCRFCVEIEKVSSVWLVLRDFNLDLILSLPDGSLDGFKSYHCADELPLSNFFQDLKGLWHLSTLII